MCVCAHASTRFANVLAQPKASCDTNIIRRMLNIYGLSDKNGIYTAIEFHLTEHKFT